MGRDRNRTPADLFDRTVKHRSTERRSDQLRAEKVKALKQQIDSGNYNVGAADVATSIVRSEVSRVLEKKPAKS